MFPMGGILFWWLGRRPVPTSQGGGDVFLLEQGENMFSIPGICSGRRRGVGAGGMSAHARDRYSSVWATVLVSVDEKVGG